MKDQRVISVFNLLITELQHCLGLLGLVLRRARFAV